MKGVSSMEERKNGMIRQRDTWLGHRLEEMTVEELCGLFEEIAGFRRTGLLKGGALRKFEREFSDNVSHTRTGECMRLVEDEILFEMGRRLYNQGKM